LVIKPIVSDTFIPQNYYQLNKTLVNKVIITNDWVIDNNNFGIDPASSLYGYGNSGLGNLPIGRWVEKSESVQIPGITIDEYNGSNNIQGSAEYELPIDINLDFACYNTANDITGIAELQGNVGNTSIPMQWATVIYFRRSELAEAVFNFMEYIKQHYEFYSLMYNFRADKYRNDFALSIALQTLTGYNIGNFAQIPGTLDSLMLGTDIVDINTQGEIVYTYPSIITRDLKFSKLKNTSIHILYKLSLFGEHGALEKFKAYEKSQQF
jgi:hypothetical protein